MKYKTLINILIALLITVILLHIAVIVRVIPYDITGGGRLKTDSEMYVFEVISILFNVFLGLVLLMKGDYIKSRFKCKTIDIILWIFLALFALNTVGNIFAKTNLEKSFAVLTLVFVILIWKILKMKKHKKRQ
ncbi:hypothetical protein E0H99_16840 [Flavobacterium sp. GT3P67]|nr:hypothetical protein E0H99_16840 [Flavobacterium sp. GT3P67]